MEQMQIPPDMQIALDYGSKKFSRAVTELRPVVWKEGADFCCLLGPDRETGIFGFGNTIAAALENWELELNERLKKGNMEDSVAQYAKDSLRVSKNDVW